MGIQQNSFTRFYPGAGFVAGLCTMTSGTPVLSKLTGNALDDACVSVADTATGIATISITNFKGPQGLCIAQATAIKGGAVLVAASTGTYSSNTASVIFGVTNTANVLADEDFTFQIWAY